MNLKQTVSALVLTTLFTTANPLMADPFTQEATARTRSVDIYATGDGVVKDTALVISLLRKRAEQGDAEAQLRLGAMYKKGNMMVAQDDKQAAHWLRKAAEQGRAEAQFLLGSLYEHGEGVAQDYKQSYAWFSSAAANGYSNAVKARDIMAKRLTPAALAEGQQLATRYFEQYRPK